MTSSDRNDEPLAAPDHDESIGVAAALAASGSYPPHRIAPECLAALPRRPGVYTFRGDGTLPLYIGKSIDIRTRVLSHLRAWDEASMLLQARHVDFTETAGEIGALLLESQRIKQENPIFNQRLRRLQGLVSISLLMDAEGGLRPQYHTQREQDLGRVAGIYGLFRSKHAAEGTLRTLAKSHQLCLGRLGLEKTSKRGCFGWQLKRCLGACVGAEPLPEHDARLRSALDALQVHVWPYDSAVALVERQGDWVQKHHVDGWRYLGTTCSRHPEITPTGDTGFDLDLYKILVRPILMGTVEVERQSS